MINPNIMPSARPEFITSTQLDSLNKVLGHGDTVTGWLGSFADKLSQEDKGGVPCERHWPRAMQCCSTSKPASFKAEVSQRIRALAPPEASDLSTFALSDAQNHDFVTLRLCAELWQRSFHPENTL
jgi:hypothetical protein